jgi:hypothetical protein
MLAYHQYSHPNNRHSHIFYIYKSLHAHNGRLFWYLSHCNSLLTPSTEEILRYETSVQNVNAFRKGAHYDFGKEFCTQNRGDREMGMSMKTGSPMYLVKPLVP